MCIKTGVEESSFCFLDDVGCGQFDPESFKNAFGIEGMKINGLPYKDPDSVSKKLYERFITFLNRRRLPSGYELKVINIKKREKGKDAWYEVVVTIKDENAEMVVGFGSDYIGPSSNWAFKAKVEDQEVGKYLKITRTFGGHIIWPRWVKVNGNYFNQLSINEARGGEKSFYDRIDITLYDLKKWYNQEVCKLKDIYDKNKSWLLQLISFDGFVDYFLFQDFVDEKYNVKDLSTFDMANETYELLGEKNLDNILIDGKEDYELFIEGNSRAIEKRNERIRLFISS